MKLNKQPYKIFFGEAIFTIATYSTMLLIGFLILKFIIPFFNPDAFIEKADYFAVLIIIIIAFALEFPFSIYSSVLIIIDLVTHKRIMLNQCELLDYKEVFSVSAPIFKGVGRSITSLIYNEEKIKLFLRINDGTVIKLYCDTSFLEELQNEFNPNGRYCTIHPISLSDIDVKFERIYYLPLSNLILSYELS